MADPSSLMSGLAERYASSLFDLALEAGTQARVLDELNGFEALTAASPDLQRLIESPVFSANEQLRAIAAIADKARLAGLTANFLRVVARNRRLFALHGIIRAYRAIEARHRGEVAATVASARSLSDEQERDLKAALKDMTGKNAVLSVTVDPSLLAGLVVRVGSRQVDTSLRTRLSTLKLALNEVG